MEHLRTTIVLLGLFAAGLVAGIWQFISPWIVTGFTHHWSPVLWSATGAAALLISISALGILSLAGLTLRSMLSGHAASPPHGAR